MATRTILRFVLRQGKNILQIREEGMVKKPWMDVPLEEESAEEISHREEREGLIVSGKHRK